MYQRLYNNLYDELMYQLTFLFRSRHGRTRREAESVRTEPQISQNATHFQVLEGTNRIELFYNSSNPVEITYNNGHLSVNDEISGPQESVDTHITQYNISQTHHITTGTNHTQINTYTTSSQQNISIDNLFGLFYNWDTHHANSTINTQTKYGANPYYLAVLAVFSATSICFCVYLCIRHRRAAYIIGQPIREL